MRIAAPEFEIDDHGSPRATAFDDIYFHPASGLDETRHVFLAGNRLPDRFAALAEGATFTVGELGFGTGLNVLAVCDLFARVAPPSARLSVVSVEGYPMSGSDMDRHLSAFPELDPWRKALDLAHLRRVPGVHRLRLGSRVDLTLYLGGIQDALESMTAPVDAWFLDGFAPSRNPDMWSETVLARVGSLTRTGGTAATFTSAGFVRRNLKAAGFEPTKVPGFGGKREMTVAEKVVAAAFLPTDAKKVPGTFLVMGGGWAGCAAAEALRRRGATVTLIEKMRLGAGASGMRQAVLEPLEGVEPTPRTAFYASAFTYARRWLKQRGLLHETGLLRRPAGHKDEAWLKRVADQAGWLDEAPYWSEEKGGLLHPSAGWIEPVQLLTALTEGIDVREQTEATGLTWTGGCWRVETSTGLIEVDAVVVANANAARTLGPFRDWPLQAVRGQMSCPRTPVPGSAHMVSQVVCGSGYVIPDCRGRYAVGATFSPGETGIDIRPQDHAQNLERLRDLTPDLAEATDWTDTRGCAGIRCSTPDRMPMIGPVPDVAAWRNIDALSEDTTDQPVWPNLYASVGHGSRGLMSGLLGGALIADIACGAPLPVSHAAFAAVNPTRFLLRRLKKQQPVTMKA